MSGARVQPSRLPFNLRLLVVLVALAQLADLATSYIPRKPGSLGIEGNPLAGALLTSPPLAIAAKVSLVVLIAASAVIVGRRRSGLATAILFATIVAGSIGTTSNLLVNL